MYTGPCLGRRRADMVRRRTACPSVWRCGEGNGRKLQHRPSMCRRGSGRIAAQAATERRLFVSRRNPVTCRVTWSQAAGRQNGQNIGAGTGVSERRRFREIRRSRSCAIRDIGGQPLVAAIADGKSAGPHIHEEPRPAEPGGENFLGDQSLFWARARDQIRLKLLPSSSSNRLA